jgi:hypothetical protein
MSQKSSRFSFYRVRFKTYRSDDAIEINNWLIWTVLLEIETATKACGGKDIPIEKAIASE